MDTLTSIKEDLSKRKRNKNEALEHMIKARLDLCNKAYIRDIDDSLKYLLSRNNFKLLNRIGK